MSAGEDDPETDFFAEIDESALKISSSQESLLARSGFLGESDDGLPAFSSSSDGPSSPAGESLRAADPPVLLCSVRSSPSRSPDPRDLGLHSSGTPTLKSLSLNPEKTEKSDLPSALYSSQTAGNPFKKNKSKKSRKRTRGARIRSPESHEELDDYGPQPQSLEILRRVLGFPSSDDARLGARKLPSSFYQPLPEGVWNGNVPGGGASSRATLADAIHMLSQNPDMRFRDMDILEIAAMKELEFSPPSWWRPERNDD